VKAWPNASDGGWGLEGAEESRDLFTPRTAWGRPRCPRTSGQGSDARAEGKGWKAAAGLPHFKIRL